MYFPSGKGAREQLWNADNDIKGILKYTQSVYLEPTHICSCFNNLWTAIVCHKVYKDKSSSEMIILGYQRNKQER